MCGSLGGKDYFQGLIREFVQRTICILKLKIFQIPVKLFSISQTKDQIHMDQSMKGNFFLGQSQYILVDLSCRGPQLNIVLVNKNIYIYIFFWNV